MCRSKASGNRAVRRRRTAVADTLPPIVTDRRAAADDRMSVGVAPAPFS